MRFFEIIPPNTRIDFVGKMKLFSTLSALLCIASIAGMIFKGFNYGVDFTGGTSVQLRFHKPIPVESVRQLVESTGARSAEVRSMGTEGTDYLVVARTEAETKGDRTLANRLIAQGGGPQQVTILQTDVVGPRTGSELRTAAILSLAYAIVLVMVYVWFRFDIMFAPGAILALLEDIIIVAGFYVFTGWEFTIVSVAALLTIAGYGVNDTIVIYDRIREMMKEKGQNVPLPEMINEAINRTLSRTTLTALITFLSVVPIIVFCDGELRGFAIAMAIGIVVGVFSTTFIAVPFTLKMERLLERFGKKAVVGKRAARLS